MALGVGTLLDGRYELEGPLGRGGMASVYRARDRRLGRPVVVKVLDEGRRDGADAAWREDLVIARLAHPHIVGIYDSGALGDGRPYLVMELLDGEPVSRLAPLPVVRALAIAAEVAAAVAYAHERGVVHCDITPGNVLIDAFGHARLTDFGVACADRAPTGAVVHGSAAYLAPERLGGAPTGRATDIYALGALLYFLLAGRPPYPGRRPEDVLAQARHGLPPPLSTLVPAVPPAVEAIVRRALALDPAGRYPSATALADAIMAFGRAAGDRTRALTVAAAADDTAVLPPATADPSSPPRAGSTAVARAGGAVAAGLLVAVLALGLVIARPGRNDETGPPAAGSPVASARPESPGAGEGTAPPAPAGRLVPVAPLRLDRLTVARGETLTGTVTYRNTGATAVTIRDLVLAARPPGGTNAGGPYLDLAPNQGGATVAPGATITLTARRTILPADPQGGWYAYSTWQDGAGVWHDAPAAQEVPFTVR